VKFRQIEAFYWLVQLRSYKRVADQLNITQPAVTARITTLEDALGFHLIDRSAPQFALTERGTELYGYAEAFVKLRDQMDASMRATQRRRFAIGVVGIIALTWGPLLREAVAEQFPELIVDFHYAFSDSEMRERVRAGLLDLAFVASDAQLVPKGSDFAVVYDIGWVGRSDICAAAGKPLTSDELGQLPLIYGPKTSLMFDLARESSGDVSSGPNARHNSLSLSTSLDLARLGYGVAAVPLAAAEDDIAAGRLLELATTEPRKQIAVHCIFTNRHRAKQCAAILTIARACADAWCAAHPRHVRLI
jgi:DNA-binding transcriptional LysR family regulator